MTAGTTFEVHDPKLVAYDKMTGNVVGEVALPRNATGAPMTYVLDGKQFIVLPTGGGNLACGAHSIPLAVSRSHCALMPAPRFMRHADKCLQISRLVA